MRIIIGHTIRAPKATLWINCARDEASREGLGGMVVDIVDREILRDEKNGVGDGVIVNACFKDCSCSAWRFQPGGHRYILQYSAVYSVAVLYRLDLFSRLGNFFLCQK